MPMPKGDVVHRTNPVPHTLSNTSTAGTMLLSDSFIESWASLLHGGPKNSPGGIVQNSQNPYVLLQELLAARNGYTQLPHQKFLFHSPGI